MLREILWNNNNTFSGLSLDSIVQRMLEIIDQREGTAVGSQRGTSEFQHEGIAASGLGRTFEGLSAW